MKKFISAIVLASVSYAAGGYLLGQERGEIKTTIEAYKTMATCAQGRETATFAVEVDADGRLARYECITIRARSA